MRWVAPTFVEIAMNAELAYCRDEADPPA